MAVYTTVSADDLAAWLTRYALGTVHDFLETGGVPLLEIRTQAGKELLIPFAKAMLINIDLERKRIDMNLPAGLDELN